MIETITRPEITETVTPEVDEIVVVVTLEDIDKGQQRQSRWCPIARAANRIVGGNYCAMGYELYVYKHDLLINGYPVTDTVPKRYYCYEATEFAQLFDTDKTLVAPERFVFKRVMG